MVIMIGQVSIEWKEKFKSLSTVGRPCQCWKLHA